MTEREQFRWSYSNGDSCSVSKEIHHVLTSMSDKSCERKDQTVLIEDEKAQLSKRYGENDNDDGILEKYFEDMSITGRNPLLILEIKEFLLFVFDHFQDHDMHTICEFAIMEARPDKEVMQKLGIAKQSTYAYKKQTVLKRLVKIGTMIPEYRGFWIPTPKEFCKSPKRKKVQNGNTPETK